MKVLFGSKNLWDFVENGFLELENETTLSQQQLIELNDSQKNDIKALLFIYQMVDEFVFERIST